MNEDHITEYSRGFQDRAAAAKTDQYLSVGLLRAVEKARDVAQEERDQLRVLLRKQIVALELKDKILLEISSRDTLKKKDIKKLAQQGYLNIPTCTPSKE